jgi:hypothetical protein
MHRSEWLSRFVVATTLLASACSSDDSASATANDASVSSVAAPLNSASIGPVPLGIGDEKTVCVTVRLNNPNALMVTSFTAELAKGSHHLIVYKSQATQESLTPASCQPFSGLLGGTEIPIMLVQNSDSKIDFPDKVGLKLEARQMLKLEAHYINTTDMPLQGAGTVHADGLTLDQASDYQAADFSFWGTTKITIEPQAALDSGVHFQTALPGTTLFALMPHQHRFGTRFRIWNSMQEGDIASDPLVDNSDWAEPPITRLEPSITFAAGQGLSYECEWQNTSDATIIFGESALQEMCFLIGYYYPADGFDPCFDGNCLNRK